MIEVLRTSVFSDWLGSLKDAQGAAKIATQIDRLAEGNAAMAKSVGGGVLELKINFGPGYRVYYHKQGMTVVILLCGGDKSSQAKDIKRARAMVQELKSGSKAKEG